MDCGWQNPEGAANSCLECLAIVASKPSRIERVVPTQTSGIRDFLCRFAMTISLQPTSDISQL
jgi:hypothetical protein